MEGWEPLNWNQTNVMLSPRYSYNHRDRKCYYGTTAIGRELYSADNTAIMGSNAEDVGRIVGVPEDV